MSRRSPSAALVDRAAAGLGRAHAPRRTVARRSFLRRSTLAATALAVAPGDFLLRPRSAYAAVCRCQGQGCPCGSLCCDGYTEFCCTLTGSNGCPPGAVAGGWWKVDGSGFCGGAPRYYIDCNAQCGGCRCRGGICNGSCSGTPCGCAGGDCNNRKWGCVKFRYGQCNQQIGCIGPIVCRVATCTPPWVFDGSCTTASRTDDRTAGHTRPCLEAPFGAFDGLADVGGAIRARGWAIDQNLRDGVEALLYVDQAPVLSTMANLPRPDVGAAYPYYGSDHGFEATVDASPGRHVVCVLARDQGSGTSTFLAFATVDVSGPAGAVDAVTATRQSIEVTGWLIDPLAPQAPATARLVIDGVAVAQQLTNVARPDVAASYGGANPTSGFRFSGPVPLLPGTHQVCVDLVYGSGRTSRLRCSEVVVP